MIDKIETEQREYRYKIILENSKTSLILLQSIFNKKKQSYYVDLLQNLQSIKNEQDESMNQNQISINIKSQIYLTEVKKSCGYMMSWVTKQRHLKQQSCFNILVRNGDNCDRKEICVKKQGESAQGFKDEHKNQDKKESELLYLIKSAEDEIKRVVNQSEMLVRKLEEYEMFGYKIQDLAKQNVEYEENQKKVFFLGFFNKKSWRKKSAETPDIKGN